VGAHGPLPERRKRGKQRAFFKRRYRVEPILSNDAAVGIEQ
jgi:hypothetical protein